MRDVKAFTEIAFMAMLKKKEGANNSFMSKNDLKDWMVCLLRDGTFLIKKGNALMGDGIYYDLRDYQYVLRHMGNKEKDIVVIYTNYIFMYSDIFFSRTDKTKILWYDAEWVKAREEDLHAGISLEEQYARIPVTKPRLDKITKADLKDWMICVARNESIGVVKGTDILFFGDKSGFHNFNDNLTDIGGDHANDIVMVFNCKERTSLDANKVLTIHDYDEPIWYDEAWKKEYDKKKKEKHEADVAAILKELGRCKTIAYDPNTASYWTEYDNEKGEHIKRKYDPVLDRSDFEDDDTNFIDGKLTQEEIDLLMAIREFSAASKLPFANIARMFEKITEKRYKKNKEEKGWGNAIIVNMEK